MRSALLLAVTLAAIPPVARAEDLARGQQLFRLCAACHGPAGRGQRQLSAPAIAGLPEWYVSAQLEKFKQGVRGHRVEDTTGLQMRPMARALVSERDVQAVARCVAGLEPGPSAVTVTGDIVRGQATYAPCGACHGERGIGNQALGAPPLAHQSDWYLVAQIEKFRLGWRGTHPRDRTGAVMRSMALALPDERAVRDVVAYIATFGRAMRPPPRGTAEPDHRRPHANHEQRRSGEADVPPHHGIVSRLRGGGDRLRLAVTQAHRAWATRP